MVTVDKAIIARFEKNGKTFELLVDATLAYELKEGKSVSIQNMLAVTHVYADSKKGMQASPSDIEHAFGTTDIKQIAHMIVRKGELQLPTEMRRKKTEETRKRIASTISKYAMDPKTRLPHPQERIENAMKQAKVHIDPFQPLEKQVEEIVAKIRPIIPISLEKIIVKIRVPAQFTGKVYKTLKTHGIREEKWAADGSLFVTVEIPSGLKEQFYRMVNTQTEGQAEIQE